MSLTRVRSFAAAAAGIVGLLSCLSAGPASAANCGAGSAGFDEWLQSFKQEAAAQGVGARGLAALNGVTFDPKVISRDRGQKVFHQSFEVFSARMVSGARVSGGHARMKQYAGLLSRIESQFGVPGAVLVAIWGLETDYGANTGNFQSIRSVATLAYDCRRSAFFRNELIAALQIVDRGDLTPGEMRGAWAGEIGQAQFMPSSYVKYAVDFDGNGRRDLERSPADVLASIANYLRSYGWSAGGGWGPGTSNFGVLKQWNKSDVYARTIAYFADKLAGKAN